MKCAKFGGCDNDAVVFVLGYRNKRTPLCEEHKGTQKVYPIDLYDKSSEELSSYVPVTSKPPSGWVVGASPPPQKSIALKDTVPLTVRSGASPSSGMTTISRQLAPMFHAPFAYWHIEDMIYPRYTAVCIKRPSAESAGGTLFASWMQAISRRYDLLTYDYSFASQGWNRDPLLRTMNGPSLFSDVERTPHPDFKFNTAFGAVIADRKSMLGGVLTSPALAHLPRPAKAFFGIHNEPVAGGNIITARNKNDELKFIVGEIGVFSLWYYDSFGSQPDITEERYGAKLGKRAAKYEFDPKQYVLWKKAKSRMRQLLLTPELFAREGEETPGKSVLFVPHWAYHIDLQMLYVGKGKIVLHSFNKQLELIREFFFRTTPERERLLTQVSALESKYRELNRKTKETLEKHGFDVIEVAGIFPNQVVDGHTKQEKHQAKPKHYFCFMNGIALFPDKVLVPHNRDTSNEFIGFAFDLFEDTLRQVGVEVIPVGNHLGADEDVNEFMFREEGGLRCKTATMPRDVLALFA